MLRCVPNPEDVVGGGGAGTCPQVMVKSALRSGGHSVLCGRLHWCHKLHHVPPGQPSVAPAAAGGLSSGLPAPPPCSSSSWEDLLTTLDPLDFLSLLCPRSVMLTSCRRSPSLPVLQPPHPPPPCTPTVSACCQGRPASGDTRGLPCAQVIQDTPCAPRC